MNPCCDMLIRLVLSHFCIVYASVSLKTRTYGNYTGDILLAAFFPIHLRTPTSFPGEFKETLTDEGIQGIETFFFALDHIQQSKLLNGFTLGGIVMDSWDDDSQAMEQAVEMIKILMTRDSDIYIPFR